MGNSLSSPITEQQVDDFFVSHWPHLDRSIQDRALSKLAATGRIKIVQPQQPEAAEPEAAEPEAADGPTTTNSAANLRPSTGSRMQLRSDAPRNPAQDSEPSRFEFIQEVPVSWPSKQSGRGRGAVNGGVRKKKGNLPQVSRSSPTSQQQTSRTGAQSCWSPDETEEDRVAQEFFDKRILPELLNKSAKEFYGHITIRFGNDPFQATLAILKENWKFNIQNRFLYIGLYETLQKVESDIFRPQRTKRKMIEIIRESKIYGDMEFEQEYRKALLLGEKYKYISDQLSPAAVARLDPELRARYEKLSPHNLQNPIIERLRPSIPRDDDALCAKVAELQKCVKSMYGTWWEKVKECYKEHVEGHIFPVMGALDCLDEDMLDSLGVNDPDNVALEDILPLGVGQSN